jgi:hypothetical protein
MNDLPHQKELSDFVVVLVSEPKPNGHFSGPSRKQRKSADDHYPERQELSMGSQSGSLSLSHSLISNRWRILREFADDILLAIHWVGKLLQLNLVLLLAKPIMEINV